MPLKRSQISQKQWNVIFGWLTEASRRPHGSQIAFLKIIITRRQNTEDKISDWGWVPPTNPSAPDCPRANVPSVLPSPPKFLMSLGGRPSREPWISAAARCKPFTWALVYKGLSRLEVDQTKFIKTSGFLLELMTLDFLLYTSSFTWDKEVPTGGSMQVIGKTLLKSLWGSHQTRLKRTTTIKKGRKAGQSLLEATPRIFPVRID